MASGWRHKLFPDGGLEDGPRQNRPVIVDRLLTGLTEKVLSLCIMPHELCLDACFLCTAFLSELKEAQVWKGTRRTRQVLRHT
jgi:hypothetical protein